MSKVYVKVFAWFRVELEWGRAYEWTWTRCQKRLTEETFNEAAIRASPFEKLMMYKNFVYWHIYANPISKGSSYVHEHDWVNKTMTRRLSPLTDRWLTTIVFPQRFQNFEFFSKKSLHCQISFVTIQTFKFLNKQISVMNWTFLLF